MYFLIFQIAYLLAIAMLVGVGVGWLFFGKSKSTAARPPAATVETHGVSEAEMAANAALRSDLAAREADVLRLRGKLRRAATELEKRATQVTTSRRAHSEVVARLGDVELALQSTDAERVHLQELADQSLANPTLWAALSDERQIREAAQIRADEMMADATASTDAALHRADEFEARLNDVERELRDADSALAALTVRAAEAEAAAEGLRSDGNAARDEREALVAQAEELREEIESLRTELDATSREKQLAVSELQIDLSAARLRADAAAHELGDLADGITAAKDESVRHVQGIQERLQGLGARVEAARATLTGRSSTSRPVEVRAPDPIGLASLPGINPLILDHLEELEVRSLAEIAGWTTIDVAQYESWLPDHPQLITSNDWVGFAKRATTADPAGPVSL